MPAGVVPGFFGKLPGLGDFVVRRLSRSFVDPWDRWLQEALAASREALGEDWREVYLSSPLWHFVLGPGVCGPEGWVGLLMPSADRVGRCFPLTVAVPSGPQGNPFTVAVRATGWMARVEAAALAALGGDAESAAALDAALGAISYDADPGAAPPPVRVGRGYWAGISSSAVPQQAYPEVLGRLAAAQMTRLSLWWTDGSQRLPPCLYLCDGLPAAEDFALMLAGDSAPGRVASGGQGA